MPQQKFRGNENEIAACVAPQALSWYATKRLTCDSSPTAEGLRFTTIYLRDSHSDIRSTNESSSVGPSTAESEIKQLSTNQSTLTHCRIKVGDMSEDISCMCRLPTSLMYATAENSYTGICLSPHCLLCDSSLH